MPRVKKDIIDGGILLPDARLQDNITFASKYMTFNFHITLQFYAVGMNNMIERHLNAGDTSILT